MEGSATDAASVKNLSGDECGRGVDVPTWHGMVPNGRYDLSSESETKAWEDGMRARTGSLCTATGRWRSSAWAMAIGAAAMLLCSAAWAQNSPALRLIKIIPVKPTAFNRATQMFSFDISSVDQVSGLYYLGDRS